MRCGLLYPQHFDENCNGIFFHSNADHLHCRPAAYTDDVMGQGYSGSYIYLESIVGLVDLLRRACVLSCHTVARLKQPARNALLVRRKPLDQQDQRV